jgi:hypothetical protein
MAARWLVWATLGVTVLAGCNPLPTPDYVDVKYPASYRTQDNARVDNEGYKLDEQGYRLDAQGERIGMVEVTDKTAGDKSNAVAGYYISSIGGIAPGRVASTSDIVAPPSTAPTPAQMPQQAPISPAPGTTAPPPGYR